MDKNSLQALENLLKVLITRYFGVPIKPIPIPPAIIKPKTGFNPLFQQQNQQQHLDQQRQQTSSSDARNT